MCIGRTTVEYKTESLGSKHSLYMMCRCRPWWVDDMWGDLNTDWVNLCVLKMTSIHKLVYYIWPIDAHAWTHTHTHTQRMKLYMSCFITNTCLMNYLEVVFTIHDSLCQCLFINLPSTRPDTHTHTHVSLYTCAHASTQTTTICWAARIGTLPIHTTNTELHLVFLSPLHTVTITHKC